MTNNAKKEHIYDAPILKKYPLNTKYMDSVDINDGSTYRYPVKLNKYGYRSDDFTRDHDGAHVVFAGCSNTFGSGGNLNEVWSYNLYEKIKQSKKLSGFYNLGIPGAGFKEIIMSIIDYFDKFGAPETLFIMLPNLERYIWYIDTFKDKQLNGYYGVCIDDNNVGKITGLHDFKTKKRKSSNTETMEEFANFVMMMKILEVFCIESNTELFWSTWDDKFFKKLIETENHTLKFYLPIIVDVERVKIISGDENDSLLKRDGHVGKGINLLWAEQFFNAYEGRINAKK